MLRTILSISGKPGLYKLISQGKNMLILETLDATKKRIPAYSHDKVISLGDIAMYTDDEEVALAEVLPTYDRDRVHTSDIKKLIQWYNVLISNGITEFVAAEEETATEE